MYKSFLKGRLYTVAAIFVEDMYLSVALLLQYLILMTLLIYGNDKFGDVRDELVTFSFPQCFHTHLKVFDQDFLKRGRKGITEGF